MARGDIILVDLPQSAGAPGHEQVGNRPALIVHEDATINVYPVIVVVPFTGQLNAQRFPHTILVQPTPTNSLTADSVLLIFQLRAIDKRRILRTIGRLDPTTMSQVDIELRQLLGLMP